MPVRKNQKGGGDNVKGIRFYCDFILFLAADMHLELCNICVLSLLQIHNIL